MPRASILLPASAAIAAGLCLAAPAQACTVSTAPVAFGAYDPRSATADDGVGTITMTCPNNAANTEVVALGTGGGTYAQRRMTSGANILNYQLYTTTTRNVVWGNGTNGTSTVNVSSKGRTTTTTVYGRITAQQNVRAGSYSDTVVVTVTY